MAIVAAGGIPLWLAGGTVNGHIFNFNVANLVTIDAANEAGIWICEIETSDGGSHTIDTTGSSALGWRVGSSVTFANAGTTVKVGLAAADFTNGPPGRAAHASDVITFDVSKSLTGGGGGITASAWNEHVPDAGTMTIGYGDTVAFAVQMTARGGADSISGMTGALPGVTMGFPVSTTFTGGAYAAPGTTALPNFVIRFSDGARGYPKNGFVASNTGTNQTWNNTSGTKEYGNFLQFPFPGKLYGIAVFATISDNLDLVLYSDPLGTPVAEKSVTIDANAISAAGARAHTKMFSSPYEFTANQLLFISAKPTSATNVIVPYLGFHVAADQFSQPLGPNGYAGNRNTGAFAAQNSSKDRFAIGALVSAFSDGSGAGGMIVSPGLHTIGQGIAA